MMKDQNLKARWIAALRSGEYQQGHSVLCDGKNYCCLGVLCRVLGAEFLIKQCWHIPEPIQIDDDVTLDLSSDGCFFSVLAANYLGISGFEQHRLALFNDGISHDFTVLEENGAEIDISKSPSKSFLEIADWIEENL